MRQKNQIADDLESTLTAQALTSTFEEIAAIRMQTIRKSVEQTRVFLDQIEAIYRQVKFDYVRSRESRGMSAAQAAQAPGKNGRTVYVIITENGGLYGDLPLRIIKYFVEVYQQHVAQGQAGKIDIFVIGSVGAYLLQNNLPGVGFTTFSLHDEHPSEEDIAKVVNAMYPYNSILVVYGYFASLLSIVPKVASISGDTATPNQQQGAAQAFADHVVYEPSIEAVDAFFETTILEALFSQKLYEMQLARFATRMVAMDTATQKSEERLNMLQGEFLKLKKRIGNKKLQEIFGGVSKW